jgi:hypothetical protein
MNIDEKFELLHRLFNHLPMYQFKKEDIRKLNFSNGIYIVFEEGEIFQTIKRIVRVGTHRTPDRLLRRLEDHIKETGMSVFRKKIGCAILNKNNPNNQDLIDHWYAPSHKEYHLIDKAVLKNIQESVTSYIVNKMWFVAFEVPRTKKEERGTLFWEAKIIATIAQSKYCHQSINWLGNSVPVRISGLKPVKKYGLWLTKELDSEPLSDIEIKELKNILENNK